jgi:hypothetical protein
MFETMPVIPVEVAWGKLKTQTKAKTKVRRAGG